MAKKLGKKIESLPDCIALADEASNLGYKVNPQTYRRFFGLIRYKGGFSEYTLNSLAKICGYENLEEFHAKQIKPRTAKYIFANNRVENATDYWDLSEELCQKIAESPELLSQIHHDLMKYPAARTYFIEHHPMRDMICSVYSQYFQEYLKYSHSNESKIFAYGFLFIGAMLSNNSEFMDIYHRKVAETELTPEVHVIPSGRKFGVPLLYAFENGDARTFSKIFDEVVQKRSYYKAASEKSVCSFEASVLEHLIFTDRKEEMKFLIENNTPQRYEDKKFIPKARKENHEETWKIMCAVAYDKMKELERSNTLLQKVDLTKLSLGWQKYYSILYYFTKYHYVEAKERIAIKQLLQQLIDETHFIYYREKLAQLK